MLITILITFTTTAGALALAANLFLNPILGMFGLAATSVATLVQLQASQRIVEAMKTRHTRKQTRITKRFVERSGRRVAATALAAATFGTVAVAGAMTSVEVMEHCDQKAELQEEANILYGTDNEFDFDRCIQESTVDAKAIFTEAKATATSRISGAFDIAERYSKEIWTSVKTATSHAIDSTSIALGRMWDKTLFWFTE